MARTNSISLLRSGWMALAVVLLAAAFISADWYYYRETRSRLDEEFARRLAAIAELAAAEAAVAAGDEPVDSPADTAGVEAARGRLDRVRKAHDLFNVVVLRGDYVTLVSCEPSLYPEGAEYPHWRMDHEALSSAFRGVAASTRLYEAGGVFLMAGYAPIPPGAAAPAAVAGVEASAGFLEGLARLRAILIVVTLVSAAGAVLFTVFAVRASASLIRARESLMQAETLATMGRMAAGIAHEIRNPLFIMRSAAEKLRARHPESREDVDGYLVEEIDRLSGILTDYLLFARDEEIPRAPFDLVVTLTRGLRAARDAIGASGVEIVTNFAVAEAPFVGDEKRLQQAFLNVLLNAGQAIRGPGTITVSLERLGGRYLARFADTGVGIPRKDLQRIFEPFFTTKTRGSGLGLSITKRIVEAHGGTIAVASEPGAGTTVTIALAAPAAPAPAPPDRNGAPA